MKLITSEDVKSIARSLGADLCGIASADRFVEAPEGFRPTDIYEKCKSVVVFAKRLPGNIMSARSHIPYTAVMNTLMQEIDKLAVALAIRLEELGTYSVIIPGNDPYEYWEKENLYGRAILSHKHAAQLAGVGVMGKNTLLVNERLGNMIYLGSMLVDTWLEPDPAITESYCPPGCRICMDSCPAKAMDGYTVNQALCRPLSGTVNSKGYAVKSCSICREVCPNRLGVKWKKASD